MSKSVSYRSFPDTSSKVQKLLHQMRTELSQLSQATTETYHEYKHNVENCCKEKWPQIVSEYRKAIDHMPKGLRRREMVRTLLETLDDFDAEIKAFTQDLKSTHVPDFKRSVNLKVKEWQDSTHRFQKKLSEIDFKISDLEENTLVQKFIRGEPVFSCRTNLQWRRKFFHAGMGLSFLFLFVYAGLEATTRNTIATFFISFSVLTEIFRHKSKTITQIVNRFFGPIMREHEKNKITAATYYILSMAFVYYVFPTETAMLTLLCIALGDPIAGIVGAKWGKTKINTHVSLEGFFACVISCTLLSALCATTLFEHTLSFFPAFFFSIFCGFIAAFSEASFKKLDDNLVMPLLSAPGLLIMMWLFGIV